MNYPSTKVGDCIVSTVLVLLPWMCFFPFWPCNLDLWPFDLIFIGERGIAMDHLFAKFGNFNFSRLGADQQTDRQNHTQMRMIAIVAWLPSTLVKRIAMKTRRLLDDIIQIQIQMRICRARLTNYKITIHNGQHNKIIIIRQFIRRRNMSRVTIRTPYNVKRQHVGC